MSRLVTIICHSPGLGLRGILKLTSACCTYRHLKSLPRSFECDSEPAGRLNQEKAREHLGIPGARGDDHNSPGGCEFPVGVVHSVDSFPCTRRSAMTITKASQPFSAITRETKITFARGCLRCCQHIATASERDFRLKRIQHHESCVAVRSSGWLGASPSGDHFRSYTNALARNPNLCLFSQ